jgi:hypothetical protein
MKKIAFILTIMLLALVMGTVGCVEEEAGPTPTPTALFLELKQPADGAEVSTSPINVTGKTIPGAVVSVSVDDEIIEVVNVGQDGKFTVAVTLEEGPNFIEVIASDQQGNEESSSVAVIYNIP